MVRSIDRLDVTERLLTSAKRQASGAAVQLEVLGSHWHWHTGSPPIDSGSRKNSSRAAGGHCGLGGSASWPQARFWLL
jgi:hypothetical protein